MNEYQRGWTAALRAVADAYGGDPADDVWQTPEGIAGIIEDLSGQARVNFVKGWSAAAHTFQKEET